MPPSLVCSAAAPPALAPAVSFGPRPPTFGAPALHPEAPGRGAAADGALGVPLGWPAASHDSPLLIAPASGAADRPLCRISLRPASVPRQPAQPPPPAGVPPLSAAAAGAAPTAQAPPASPFAAPRFTEGWSPAAKACEAASFPGPACAGSILGAVTLTTASGSSEGLPTRSSLSSLRSSHTAAGACSRSRLQVMHVATGIHRSSEGAAGAFCFAAPFGVSASVSRLCRKGVCRTPNLPFR